MDEFDIERKYCYEFNDRVSFIEFYLRKTLLRRLKFSTQDKFWSLNIIVGRDDYYKGKDPRYADGSI
ncbi:MAG: hypothetical protein K2M94_08115, partial [Paramuribaculum sp.]|nr:hypothetical protein [Paramuribaculum sp.]